MYTQQIETQLYTHTHTYTVFGLLLSNYILPQNSSTTNSTSFQQKESPYASTMIDENDLSDASVDHIQQVLRRMVWQALDYELLPSAEFACERLRAMDNTNLDSIHLMALVWYKQGKYKASRDILESSISAHPGCLYVYILCSYKLGRYNDGISALQLKSQVLSEIPDSTPGSDTERSSIPDKSVFDLWEGKLRMARGDFNFDDKEQMVKSLVPSVRKNPYMYESVDLLAKLRISLQVDNIFKPEQLDKYFLSTSPGNNEMDYAKTGSGGDPFIGSNNTNTNNSTNPSFTFKTSQSFLKSAIANKGSLNTDQGLNTPTASHHNNPRHNNEGNNDSFTTPSDDRSRLGHSRIATNNNLPLAPQKRATRSRSNLSFDSKPPAFEPPKRQVRASTVAKRTTRNANNNSNNQPSYATTTTTKKHVKGVSNSSKLGPAKIGGNHPTASRLKTVDKDSMARNEAKNYLTELFTILSWINIYYNQYKCKKALEFFDQLTISHKDTPWAITKAARSHFELVEYKESLEYFRRLHEKYRCRVDDMDYYSTLLWHLQKDFELGYLAYELIDADRTAPEGWCALGNSFSLKKEPDLALKCFKRAIQLNPNNPYAYTLQAHEHVTNEAYENAQISFRKAIKADNCHYNAWYGLGMVAMRLGQIGQSEMYFKEANRINPNNVVLICCEGMAAEKRGYHSQALKNYEKACELQPKSALSRYRKARALINLKMYTEALNEFDILGDLAPDEASVYFLLGQLHKVLQNRELAVKNFTIALNLDPKGSHLIKEALSGLNGGSGIGEDTNSMSI